MIRVYNKNMQLLALLNNAFDISYDQKLNNLWTAEFSLPADDTKNEYCLPFNFVEIFDGNERVELFRIMPINFEKNNDGLVKTYSCEHVIATLFDDIMFKYHQTTLSPAATIDFILDHQTTQRWQVGTVDFGNFFSYKWENENLFNALFGIAKTYDFDYQWTWNTSTYPWTINLIQPSSEISAYVRYRKNLKGITKEEDPTNVVTRYYVLGYGEGDNQLTIESVNSGLPYIDSDNQSSYGVISDFYIDKTEENPATLKAKAQTALNKAKIPKVTYSIDAADIYQITNESIDKFDLGKYIKVYDAESGIEFTAKVMGKNKPNLTSNPGDVKLEISNIDTNKISSQFASMQNRQRVQESYSQGATNIDSNDYQDNCDAIHPATIEFYIPEDCVRVNECWLSYKTSKFRAYEKSALAKDLGTVSISTSTTSGGNHRHSIVSQQVSGPLGGAYETHYHNTSEDNTSDSGGHQHGMDHSHTIGAHSHTIEYGIFEEETLPTGLQVKVDGSLISVTDLNTDKIDIVPYLSKDTEGKINRGVFHTVEITPNDLARITASVVKKIFIQSRGTYSV